MSARIGGKGADSNRLAVAGGIFPRKRFGTALASTVGMAGVQRFEDLFAWQLSSQLRDEILPITERTVWKDSRFRDQIRDSSSSPPRNIAEGFGRYRPKEFAYFVHVAQGSLQETRNHIYDARKRKYINADETNRLLRLQARAAKATTRLLLYLESCDGNPPDEPKPPET